MVEGIFGKKLGMTHVFAEDGTQVPVTVIQADDCYVVQRKTVDRDGYDAVQVGAGVKKEKTTSAGARGHFKKAGIPCLSHIAEFGGENLDGLKPGTTIKCADVFRPGDFVDVAGVTKGKGFQGTMRRWGFAGGKASHGSMHGRGPGSIGQSADPSKVIKGVKMSGRTGGSNTTIENLQVVDVKADGNLILIKGPVPGPRNGYLVIKRAHKKPYTPPQAAEGSESGEAAEK